MGARPNTNPKLCLSLGLFLVTQICAHFSSEYVLKLPGAYGPLRVAHLILFDHRVFSCGHEIHGCVYDVLQMVGMFFSC
jgi:hypothetical protein